MAKRPSTFGWAAVSRLTRLHLSMSTNRENVIWQSADGTWSRGFYDYYDTKSYDDEDYDYEWDVEYNYDTFTWVSAGHSTMEQARAAWKGANPGGANVIEYPGTGMNGEVLAPQFDEMAVACAASGGYAPGVDPKKVRDYEDRAALSRFYFTQRSFDKNWTPSDFFAADDTRELKSVQDLLTRRPELAEYARECRQKLVDSGEKRVEEARSRQRYSYGPGSSQVGYEMARAEAILKFVDRLKVPSERTAVSSDGGAQRRKTTAASTAGSFAPKVGSAPAVTL